jgi:hypothetical protein
MAGEIKALDNLMDLYREEKVLCRQAGTVFLTFSDQRTVAEILEEYEGSLLKTLLTRVLSPLRVPPLMLKDSVVVVAQAPGPRDVIWENLSYSFLRSVVAEVLFVVLMVVVLGLAFRLQSVLVEFAYRMRR